MPFLESCIKNRKSTAISSNKASRGKFIPKITFSEMIQIIQDDQTFSHINLQGLFLFTLDQDDICINFYLFILSIMEINIINQNEAKAFIKDIMKERVKQFDQSQILQLQCWLNETHSVKSYLLKEDVLVSFALLSKMDYDPWNRHKVPWTLNFIYTFSPNRRKGHARKLLSWIKKREETSAFCSNEHSEKLFDSAKFHRISEHPIPTYRFP